MKLINIKKVYKNRHNSVEALKKVNLELVNDGLIVILGPSGCGKTSLLNIISGDDTNYEGDRLDVPKISYLTQELELFESMTTYENLNIVSNNIQLIEHYLRKYDMWDHRNKKVKKCSSGQKKRVQFLCALLQKPNLLLCDEPTAALDHENKKILMDDLKEVSKDIQVIVVTHDIAIAEMYADRIIRMGEGIIESDTTINTTNLQKNNYTKSKKKYFDIFELILLKCKSRIIETCFLVALLLMGVISIFSIVGLYKTVEKQTDNFLIFKNAKNVVVSYPVNDELIPDPLYVSMGMTEPIARDFDFFYYMDIKSAIDYFPEIIAVEAFYNNEFYFGLNDQSNYSLRTPGIFKDLNMPIRKELTEKSGGKWENIGFNRPNSLPVFLSAEDQDLLIRNEKYISDNQKGEEIHTKWMDFELQEELYTFHFFDIIDIDSFPIISGSEPMDNDEIIIAKNTAELLMDYLGYDSYESLIGEEIVIGLESRRTQAAIEPSLNYAFDDDTAHFYEMIPLKITGVTSVENDYMNTIFFNTEFAHNAITSYFVEGYENLHFHYVNFIVDPETDVNTFANNISKAFPNEKSKFILFTNSIIEEKYEEPQYRDVKNLIIFGVSIVGIFIFSLLVYYLFANKRIRKEQRIMLEYEYPVHVEIISRTILINTISFLIVVIFGQFICEFVNQFAINIGYGSFIEYDLKLIIFSSLIVLLINYFSEYFVCGVKK